MNTPSLMLLLLACTADPAPDDGPIWVDLEAAHDATCALDSAGAVSCWGSPTWTDAEAPDGPFTQVAMSVGRACGLRSDGSLTCWGIDDGAGNLEPPAGVFTGVATGDLLGCARDADGAYACWGQTEDLTLPERSAAVKFDVTERGLCELDAAGALSCTGTLNGSSPLSAQAPPPGTYLDVDLGHSKGCAVRADGRAVDCWASRVGGSDVLIEGAGLTRVFTGLESACALDAGQELLCAGENPPYQDGLSLTGPFVDVAAGSAHVCALRVGGEIVCEGADDLGQSSPPAGRNVGEGG